MRLENALKESVNISDGPSAIRFPKGAVGQDIDALDTQSYGERIFGKEDAEVTIVSIGALAKSAIEAANALTEAGISVEVIDPIVALPVNPELIDYLASAHLVVTVEDGLVDGGIGQAICAGLTEIGGTNRCLSIGIPKQFLTHKTRKTWLTELGLDGVGIAAAVTARLRSQVQ
jgi:1-deoxy-D-xylulose-5-phosphate synthase